MNTTNVSSLSILLAGNNMQRLLGGLDVAIKINLVAVALSVPLGALFGLSMARKNSVTKLLSRVYFSFIYIMPQLVLLLLVFFGSARVFGLNLSGEFSSIFVFVLRDTAETGDLVQGALENIPRHQYESAAALDSTPGQYSCCVIIPQTLRRLLPLAISLVVHMIRTISLVILIDVVKVLRTGQQIIDTNRLQYPTAALPIYGVTFLLYFLVYRPVSTLAHYLEKRWAV